MSTESELFAQTLERLFTRECSAEAVRAAEATWPAGMWGRFEESALTLVSVAESAGGAGGGLDEALTLLQVAGRHACPLPLAETAVLAGWLLQLAGLPIDRGPMAVAQGDSLSLVRAGGGWRLSGEARGVPWGRSARIVFVISAGGGTHVAVADPLQCSVSQQSSVAGEPRDTVRCDQVLPRERVASLPADAVQRLAARGAMTRTALIAGALGRVLEMTVAYANARVQFGRPLVKFQAVQHHLATMAGEVATAMAAASSLVGADPDADHIEMLVSAAKARASEAAGRVAASAHQVHGAIGTTREHDLQLFTRRLLLWRGEYGSELLWSRRLGEHVIARGARDLWPALTSL